MPSVTFRLPPATHERFVAQCAERDITVSDFLRQAVDKFVDLMDEPRQRMEPAPRMAASGLDAVREPLARQPDVDGRLIPAFAHSPLPLGGFRANQPKPIGYATDGTPLYAKAGTRLKATKEKK